MFPSVMVLWPENQGLVLCEMEKKERWKEDEMEVRKKEGEMEKKTKDGKKKGAEKQKPN